MVTAAFIVSIASAVVAVASVLVAIDTKKAADRQADAAEAQVAEMKAQNAMLREQLELEWLKDIRKCLSTYEAARHYLQSVSGGGFAWHTNQRDVARNAGIDPVTVTNMCQYLNSLLVDGFSDEVRQFIRGAEEPLRAVLNEPDYNSFERLRRHLDEDD